MRLFFLLGAVALTSGLLYGQVRQGDLIMTPSSGNPALLTSSPLAISGSGGSISLSTGDEGIIVALLPAVGYAITDNFVAGLGINFVVGRDFKSDFADGLSPYLRYYVFNQKKWHLYGGGRATIVFSKDDIDRIGRTQLLPNLGLGFALGEGIYFSPELSYAVNRENSPLRLELKFDVRVPTQQRNPFAKQPRYKQGTWMLGTRMGRLSFAAPGNGRSLLQLSPEVHFFTADQVALGLEIGTEISGAANVPTKSSVHGGLTFRYIPVYDRSIDLFVQAGVHVESAGGGLSERLDPDGGAMFHVDGGVGAMIFPRDYFALEAGLGAAHYPGAGFTEVALSGGLRIFPWR